MSLLDTKRSIFGGVLVAGLLSTTAYAGPGAATGVGTISPCPSFCGGSGGAFESDIDGGEGFSSSFSSVNNVDGDGRAQAIFIGNNLLPQLKADAFSNAQGVGVRSSRVGADATGVQEYVYSGPDISTSVSAMFDGIVTDSGPGENDARIGAQMVLVLADSGADLDFITDFGTLVFELLGPVGENFGGLTNLGSDEATLPITGQQETGSLSVAFDIDDGDRLFVWSGLQVSGTRGGFADAFSTLNLSFGNGGQGFIPQLGAAVPTPASAALILLGLISLVSLRRR